METQIVTGVTPVDRSPRQVAAAFRKLLDEGVAIRPDGEAADDPEGLLSRGYTPKHEIHLFGATFYLTNLRSDPNFRFFVAYVLLPGASARRRVLHPRIFYKDSSLVWRCPSHYIRSDDDNWVGKGDLKTYVEDGVLMESSAEETTNLPLELQAALDIASRRGGRVRRDDAAIPLVVRRAPDGRFEPYRDFTEPRRRAMADARNLINGGEYVASFRRDGDPGSLRFVRGFEPDFGDGVIETSELRSRFYGGLVRKLRILSKNRKIQYQFAAGPKHVWIIPPQTLTTELSSYAVRTVDVNAAEDAFVPGYEYHYMDQSEDPPQLHSQIPEGYAGAANEVDPTRSDASAWLEKLPVIQEFRKRIRLGS